MTDLRGASLLLLSTLRTFLSQKGKQSLSLSVSLSISLYLSIYASLSVCMWRGVHVPMARISICPTVLERARRQMLRPACKEEERQRERGARVNELRGFSALWHADPRPRESRCQEKIEEEEEEESRLVSLFFFFFLLAGRRGRQDEAKEEEC